MQAAIGGEKMLRRIVAMLVALAVLAERAADRSWPVRFIVLWLLRRAETAVHGYVLEETGMPVIFEDFAPVGSGPDDALHLAWRFRALAAALAALLPDARPPDRGSARSGLAFGRIATVQGWTLGGWMPEPIDTS